MAGLADGFLAGFNTMENHYQRQENNEYRDKAFQAQQDQQAKDNEYRSKVLGMQEHQANVQNAESVVRMAGLGMQNDLAGKQLANYDADRARQIKADEMGLKATQAQIDASNARTKATNWQADYYGSKANIENTKLNREKTASRLQYYYATGDWGKFMLDDSFKGTDAELLQNANGGEAAIGLYQGLQSGDESAIVNNFNSLYKSKLNRNVGNMQGRDGGVIRDISAVGYEEGQDENGNPVVKIPVRVTTDKGQYTSYVSEMRGIDPDDPDKTFSPDELIGKVGAMGQMATILKSSGAYDEVNKSAGRLLGAYNQDNRSAKEKQWQFIESKFGPEGLQRFIYSQQGQDPAKARQQIVLEATKMVNGDISLMNASPEEKQAAIQQLSTTLEGMVYGPQQSTPYVTPPGGQQGAGQGVNPQQQQLLEQLRQINAQMGQ